MRPITAKEPYIEYLVSTLQGTGMKANIDSIAHAVLRVWKNDRRVFVCGNGGSSSIASHFTNDLLKFIPGGIPAVCLSDNIPFLTAVANDEEYAAVFREQLLVAAVPGDLLVAISCSGKSLNVVQAIEVAATVGMEIVSLTAGAISPLASRTLEVKGTVCHFWHPDIRGQEDLMAIALHIAVGEVSDAMIDDDPGEENLGR